MKLNLVNLEESNIKYKISKFPDGQQNITLDPEIAYVKVNRESGSEWKYIKPESYHWFNVKIISHLNNFRDLELIIATTACLRELGIEKISLYTPYFVGARSDRKFEEGGNWYLRDVICPIINSLNFTTVTIMDPHSFVLENLIKNFKSIDNEEVVRFGLSHTAAKSSEGFSKWSFENIVLVAPDAGASHKIYKLAEKIGYKGNIIICSKERDTEGKLTKTFVPGHGINPIDYIIIDDICDGGRTFINIAQELKKKWIGFNHNPKIYLIITHGIFSAGFTELSKYFDGIYCTNSYSTVGDFYGNDMEKTNVKQLNVY